MKAIGIIPARWASTRFEGKVLAEIAGKPMIQHVWERAGQAERLDDLMIACDDQRVFDAAAQFGAKAVMTSADHNSGTDRIAQVLENIDAEIVVNIQGDEPLIHHSIIDDLVGAVAQDKDCSVATVIKLMKDEKQAGNPNVVKVVIDENKNALYFSRSPIPFHRGNQEAVYWKHLGIYAYTKDFLKTFVDLPKSSLETVEQLEQLRILEAGYKIKTIVTEMDTVGVDTPEDLKSAEKAFKG